MKWIVVNDSNLCWRLHFFSQDPSMRWSLGEESLCLSQCSWTLAFSESHGRRVLGLFFCQGEASELQQDWCHRRAVTLDTELGNRDGDGDAGWRRRPRHRAR